MSFIRKTLRTIYPPHDELTVYSMALAIGFLALLNRQFAELLVNAVYVMSVVETADAFSSGWWDGVKYVFGASMLLLFMAFGLIASIWLPFTRRRFDEFVAIIILAHSILMCTANFIAAQEDGGVGNQAIAAASLIWFLGYCLTTRKRWNFERVSHRQASAMEALVAGAAIFAAVGLSSLVLHWHWASCYAFAFVNAITVTQLFNKIIGDDSIQEEATPRTDG